MYICTTQMKPRAQNKEFQQTTNAEYSKIEMKKCV